MPKSTAQYGRELQHAIAPYARFRTNRVNEYQKSERLLIKRLFKIIWDELQASRMNPYLLGAIFAATKIPPAAAQKRLPDSVNFASSKTLFPVVLPLATLIFWFPVVAIGF